MAEVFGGWKKESRLRKARRVAVDCACVRRVYKKSVCGWRGWASARRGQRVVDNAVMLRMVVVRAGLYMRRWRLALLHSVVLGRFCVVVVKVLMRSSLGVWRNLMLRELRLQSWLDVRQSTLTHSCFRFWISLSKQVRQQRLAALCAKFVAQRQERKIVALLRLWRIRAVLKRVSWTAWLTYTRRQRLVNTILATATRRRTRRTRTAVLFAWRQWGNREMALAELWVRIRSVVIRIDQQNMLQAWRRYADCNKHCTRAFYCVCQMSASRALRHWRERLRCRLYSRRSRMIAANCWRNTTTHKTLHGWHSVCVELRQQRVRQGLMKWFSWLVRRRVEKQKNDLALSSCDRNLRKRVLTKWHTFCCIRRSQQTIYRWASRLYLQGLSEAAVSCSKHVLLRNVLDIYRKAAAVAEHQSLQKSLSRWTQWLRHRIVRDQTRSLVQLWREGRLRGRGFYSWRNCCRFRRRRQSMVLALVTSQRLTRCRRVAASWHQWCEKQRVTRNKMNRIRKKRQTAVLYGFVSEWHKLVQVKQSLVREFIERLCNRRSVAAMAEVFGGWKKESRLRKERRVAVECTCVRRVYKKSVCGWRGWASARRGQRVVDSAAMLRMVVVRAGLHMRRWRLALLHRVVLGRFCVVVAKVLLRSSLSVWRNVVLRQRKSKAQLDSGCLKTVQLAERYEHRIAAGCLSHWHRWCQFATFSEQYYRTIRLQTLFSSFLQQIRIRQSNREKAGLVQELVYFRYLSETFKRWHGLYLAQVDKRQRSKMLAIIKSWKLQTKEQKLLKRFLQESRNVSIPQNIFADIESVHRTMMLRRGSVNSTDS